MNKILKYPFLVFTILILILSSFNEVESRKYKLKKIVIDDIKIGTGNEVVVGSKVSVHYIGTLQSGQEFDNSNKRGTPFTFTVGEGKVIKGWEEGLLGMKAGGQRILVIPPELAYGDSGIGPIPPKATLVFAIDLILVE